MSPLSNWLRQLNIMKTTLSLPFLLQLVTFYGLFYPS